MNRVDSRSKKKIDAFRERRNAAFSAEENALKREKEKSKMQSSPEFEKDAKKRQVLQTISEAWNITMRFRKEVKKTLTPGEHFELKQTALENAKQMLIDLILADFKTLNKTNISKEEVAQLFNYYILQLDVLQQRSEEIGVNDMLEQINNELQEKLQRVSVQSEENLVQEL